MKNHVVIAGLGTRLVARGAYSRRAEGWPSPKCQRRRTSDQRHSRSRRTPASRRLTSTSSWRPQLGLALAGGNATLGQGSDARRLGHFSIGVRGNVFNGTLPQVAPVHAEHHAARGRAAADQGPSRSDSRPLTRRSASSRAFRSRSRMSCGIDALVSAAYVPTINIERRHDHAAAPTGSSATARASACSRSRSSCRASRSRGSSAILPTTDIVGTVGQQLQLSVLNTQGQDVGVARRREQELHRLRRCGRRRPGQVRPVRGHLGARVSQGGLHRQRRRCRTRLQSLTRTNVFVDASLNLPLFKLVAEVGQVSGGTRERRTTRSRAAAPIDRSVYGSVGLRFGW